MVSIQKRLQAVMRNGNLRVADLTRWFDRPDPTVRGWVNGVKPAGAPHDQTDVEDRLKNLEKLVAGKVKFPIPPRTSAAKRIKLLKDAAAI